MATLFFCSIQNNNVATLFFWMHTGRAAQKPAQTPAEPAQKPALNQSWGLALATGRLAAWRVVYWCTKFYYVGRAAATSAVSGGDGGWWRLRWGDGPGAATGRRRTDSERNRRSDGSPHSRIAAQPDRRAGINDSLESFD